MNTQTIKELYHGVRHGLTTSAIVRCIGPLDPSRCEDELTQADIDESNRRLAKVSKVKYVSAYVDSMLVMLWYMFRQQVARLSCWMLGGHIMVQFPCDDCGGVVSMCTKCGREESQT